MRGPMAEGTRIIHAHRHGGRGPGSMYKVGPVSPHGRRILLGISPVVCAEAPYVVRVLRPGPRLPGGCQLRGAGIRSGAVLTVGWGAGSVSRSATPPPGRGGECPPPGSG